MPTIPDTHADLVRRPIVASLVTQMPNGYPQATPVWFSYDGEFIWVNTESSRQKAQNMRSNPKVALLIVDPDNPYRYLELRGDVVEETTDGAVEHIHHLCSRYFGREDFYQNAPHLRDVEVRVIFKIKPMALNAY
jgi:PPOX class probable F420-dependent enzyme